MDLRSASTSRTVHCILVVFVLLNTATSAPSSASSQKAEPDSLEKVVLDLQNVLYRLENYALKKKFEDTRDHSYPEIVEGVYEKKVSDVEKELPQSIVSPHAIDQRPPEVKSNEDATSDISLKDALDFLVKFAKEKKQERRDHDIPFPVNAQKQRE